MSRVYVIILNWNRWHDTIECLESLFRVDYPDYRVVVCDNGSPDGSVDRIKAWAEGRLDVRIPVDNPHRHLCYPPVRKPISCLEVRWGAAKEGKANGEYPLVLISIGKNLGYAGGNNVGLRYVQSLGDYDYIWLLNNDTVVHPDALTHLVRRMEEKPDAGICGSTLPYYDAPDRLWARGGAAYNRWTGYSRCIGLNRPVKDSFDWSRVENAMKYVAGASMLVSRPFLQDAGFLSEEYFLYFEELDWITGAKGRYRLAYAPESIVFHKVGASTDNGVLNDGERLSPKAQMEKSRMIYTRKYFPFALPTVFLYGMARRWASFLKRDRKR